MVILDAVVLRGVSYHSYQCLISEKNFHCNTTASKLTIQVNQHSSETNKKMNIIAFMKAALVRISFSKGYLINCPICLFEK